MFEDTMPIQVTKFKDHHKGVFRKYALVGGLAYIGRGSPLGNPYSSKKSKHDVTEVKDSDEAIARFEDDLYNRKLEPEAYQMIGEIILQRKRTMITLVCFCKPNRCHGDVIREYIENGGKRGER